MATKKAPASKKAPAGKKASARPRVTQRSIRNRAEEIYLKRINEGIPGDAESDWQQAEKELRSQ